MFYLKSMQFVKEQVDLWQKQLLKKSIVFKLICLGMLT